MNSVGYEKSHELGVYFDTYFATKFTLDTFN